MTVVVVGVDGSPASTAALKWAAAEAWLREVELLVLASYRWRPLGGHLPGRGEARPPVTEQRAREIVDEAVASARTITSEVRGRTVAGHPVKVMLEAARDAGLVVVGDGGRGGFTGLLLGSASAQVSAHSPGPVVVVRGRANTAIGPVVVGVDSSHSAQQALRTAFAETALRRQAPLVAVTAYTAPLPPWTGGMPPIGYDAERLDADLRAELASRLATWRDGYPDVVVECEVVRGAAAAILAERSRQAQLLIVGARSHGGFDGLLLGSVSQHLLHHADCPVLIARTRN
ncbi:universal stress protein [Planosporangium mesophilum]|uniref:Universal stress protein n=1 Tax=Planosporangium mesophilum TaxID=689768 RepID=A0A8J3T730_9ACTN|nr:universal stress protein [Planosporangium mesophilum]NJC85656.1 universal stress protein [Planosporangium mesophilum]GII21448.1 universal stress protein [Planosporangium mesophilum]